MKWIITFALILGLASFGLVRADGPDVNQAPPPDFQLAGIDKPFGLGGPDFQNVGRRGGRGDDPRHAGLGEGRHLEQFRTLKLLELLDLNEDQEDRFLKEFRDLRRDLKVIREGRDSAITELSAGLHNETMTDSQVNALVDRILGFQEKQRQRETAFHNVIKKILTPQQLGRMVVFDQRFDRELLNKMEAFRNRPMRGPKMFDSLHGSDDN